MDVRDFAELNPPVQARFVYVTDVDWIIRTIDGDDFGLVRRLVQPNCVESVNETSKPPCFWRLDGLGCCLAFRSFAVTTHLDNESALFLLDLKLMGNKAGKILADSSQDPGIIVGRLV